QVKLGKPLAPGQHMALIGPTGCAKTTHAVGVLGECRKYVLALDPKGEDETLAQSGYRRVLQVPRDGWRAAVDKALRQNDQREWDQIYKRIEAGQDARVIVGGGARTDKEDVALQTLMREAITFARHAGGWTLYIDEFELLRSQLMYKLGAMIERMLITARRARTSVVTTFQAPAWVSKHATRQARYAVIWPQDADMIKNISRGMSRDWRDVGRVTDELPEFHTVTMGRGKLAGPMVITKAPKLPARPGNPAAGPGSRKDGPRRGR
ncbi:MAG TPA: hypothetical protein VM782_21065, partial [Stellaceae bacterium]|nr:hypothetical protein [Stellaceae bacterium]